MFIFNFYLPFFGGEDLHFYYEILLWRLGCRFRMGNLYYGGLFGIFKISD